MLIPKLTMKGTIKNHGVITASVVEHKKLTGYIRTGTSSFKPYLGDYEIIPYKDDIVLETQNKYMTEDLTIKEIPYAQVGNTITIGG